jgi:EmrB/QacA subfamily drug resistance transporter
MFLIPFGRLADLYGRKKVFLYGISVFTIASALLGIYPSSSTLVLFRALQGVGSSMIFGTSLAILVSVSTTQERGSMLGITIASVYIGLSIGPYLGGVLTKNYGWRSIFLVNVILGLSVIILIFTKLTAEWKINDGSRFDFLGSAAFGLMLLSLMYGVSKLPSRASFLPIGIGIVLTTLFIYIEGRVDNPVLELGIFKTNKAYTLFNITALINFSATFSITFLLSMYLQYLKELDPQQAGTIMIASPIIQAVASPLAGKLSDKIHPAKLATLGMVVTGLSLAPLALLTTETSLTYILLSLIVLGIGLSLFSSPNTNAIMSSVDTSLLGVASSTVGTMRLTGQMLSQGIAMTLIAINLGSAAITPVNYPELLTSIRSSFTVFLILCIVGALASHLGEMASSNHKE